MDNFNQR